MTMYYCSMSEGERIIWGKKVDTAGKCYLFQKGGYNVDLLLSSYYQEVNCRREYENRVCDISFFPFYCFPSCFYETNQFIYSLFSRQDCLQIQKCLNGISIKMLACCQALSFYFYIILNVKFQFNHVLKQFTFKGTIHLKINILFLSPVVLLTPYGSNVCLLLNLMEVDGTSIHLLQLSFSRGGRHQC